MVTATTRNRPEAGGLRTLLRTRIELWLVVLFMALSFGAGVLVTALYEEPAPPPTTFQAPAFPIAPPLTEEQIEQGLPSGHPDISGGGAAGPAGPGGAEAGAPQGDAGA
ncbi:hypothetical protein HRbin12_00084 [bacterium HR12]|nr:hypothetical protein HRbin12_00084 [bacterium HR12]